MRYSLCFLSSTQQVVAGLKALIRNPNITVRQLMQHIPAPDFPTGERFAALGVSEPHQGLQPNRASSDTALRLGTACGEPPVCAWVRFVCQPAPSIPSTHLVLGRKILLTEGVHS